MSPKSFHNINISLLKHFYGKSARWQKNDHDYISQISPRIIHDNI